MRNGRRRMAIVVVLCVVAASISITLLGRWRPFREFVLTAGGCCVINQTEVESPTEEIPYYDRRTQIAPPHIATVLNSIQSFAEPKVLVWGTGYDSRMWCLANPAGATVFLEDVPKWVQETRKTAPCRIELISYRTSLRQAYSLLGQDDALRIDLPADIVETDWDVIIVDGPMGWQPQHPGRMQSIFMSSRLAYDRSHVFVDDYCRPVEYWYSKAYLTPKFGEPVIYQGRGGFAHYHGTNRDLKRTQLSLNSPIIFKLWSFLRYGIGSTGAAELTR